MAFPYPPRQTPEPPAPPKPPRRPTYLKAVDRCDRRGCGAQAYVAVEFRTGDLLFCAHHFTELEAGIRKVSLSIIDERWQLDEANKREFYN